MSECPHSDDLDDLRAAYKQLCRRVTELEGEVEDLRSENQKLRERTRFFKQIQSGKKLTKEARACKLLSQLHNEALARKEDGQAPKAVTTRGEASKVLGGDLQNQQLHDAMDCAEQMDEHGAVEKVTGDPGRGGKETKLILDLRQGPVPAEATTYDAQDV